MCSMAEENKPQKPFESPSHQNGEKRVEEEAQNSYKIDRIPAEFRTTAEHQGNILDLYDDCVRNDTFYEMSAETEAEMLVLVAHYEEQERRIKALRHHYEEQERHIEELRRNNDHIVADLMTRFSNSQRSRMTPTVLQYQNDSDSENDEPLDLSIHKMQLLEPIQRPKILETIPTSRKELAQRILARNQTVENVPKPKEVIRSVTKNLTPTQQRVIKINNSIAKLLKQEDRLSKLHTESLLAYTEFMKAKTELLESFKPVVVQEFQSDVESGDTQGVDLSESFIPQHAEESAAFNPSIPHSGTNATVTEVTESSLPSSSANTQEFRTQGGKQFGDANVHLDFKKRYIQSQRFRPDIKQGMDKTNLIHALTDPIYVDSFVIDAANGVQDKILKKWEVPFSLLSAGDTDHQNVQRAAIDMFTYFRADAIITLQTKGQPFQSGAAIMAWLPPKQRLYAPPVKLLTTAGSFHESDLKPGTRVFREHGVVLNFAESTTVSFRVPYSHWANYIHAQDTSDLPQTWGSIYLGMLTNFNAMSGGATRYSFQMYVSWDSIDLVGPRPPQLAMSRMLQNMRSRISGDPEAAKYFDSVMQWLVTKKCIGSYKADSDLLEEVSEVIDDVVTGVGDVANVVSKGINLATQVATDVGGIFALFGLDRPIEPPGAHNEISLTHQKGLGHAVCTDHSEQFGMRPTTVSAPRDEWPVGTPARTTAEIARIPCLIARFTILPTHKVGDQLFRIPISPIFSSGLKTNNYVVPPCEAMASCYDSFRGGMSYSFRAIASGNAQARLDIAQCYGRDGSEIIDMQQASHYEMQMFDISGTKDSTYNTKYIQSRDFCVTNKLTDMHMKTVGDLRVYLGQELTVNPAAPQRVDVLVFAACADDIEFGVLQSMPKISALVTDTTNTEPQEAESIKTKNVLTINPPASRTDQVSLDNEGPTLRGNQQHKLKNRATQMLEPHFGESQMEISNILRKPYPVVVSTGVNQARPTYLSFFQHASNVLWNNTNKSASPSTLVAMLQHCHMWHRGGTSFKLVIPEKYLVEDRAGTESYVDGRGRVLSVSHTDRPVLDQDPDVYLGNDQGVSYQQIDKVNVVNYTAKWFHELNHVETPRHDTVPVVTFYTMPGLNVQIQDVGLFDSGTAVKSAFVKDREHPMIAYVHGADDYILYDWYAAPFCTWVPSSQVAYPGPTIRSEVLAAEPAPFSRNTVQVQQYQNDSEDEEDELDSLSRRNDFMSPVPSEESMHSGASSYYFNSLRDFPPPEPEPPTPPPRKALGTRIVEPMVEPIATVMRETTQSFERTADKITTGLNDFAEQAGNNLTESIGLARKEVDVTLREINYSLGTHIEHSRLIIQDTEGMFARSMDRVEKLMTAVEHTITTASEETKEVVRTVEHSIKNTLCNATVGVKEVVDTVTHKSSFGYGFDVVDNVLFARQIVKSKSLTDYIASITHWMMHIDWPQVVVDAVVGCLKTIDNIDFLFQDDNDKSVNSKFVSALWTVLKVIAGTVKLPIVALEKFCAMFKTEISALCTVGRLMNAIKSIGSFFTWMKDVISWLWENIGSWTTGLLTNTKKEAMSFSQDVKALAVTLSDPNARVTVEVVAEVDRLTEEAKRFTGKKVASELRQAMNAADMALMRIRQDIARRTTKANYRVDPFCVKIYGNSGVGKSVASIRLARDMAHLNDLDPTTYSYNEKNERLDGYNNQDILLIDDGGQFVEGRFAETMIQMGNNLAYTPMFANLADKGREFSSKLVIVSSNEAVLDRNDEVYHPEAVNRRFKYLTEAVGNPLYGRIEMDQGKEVFKIGKMTDEAKKNLAYIQFRRVNPSNVSEKGPLMTYKEWLRDVQIAFVDHLTVQGELVASFNIPSNAAEEIKKEIGEGQLRKANVGPALPKDTIPQEVLNRYEQGTVFRPTPPPVVAQEENEEPIPMPPPPQETTPKRRYSYNSSQTQQGYNVCNHDLSELLALVRSEDPHIDMLNLRMTIKRLLEELPPINYFEYELKAGDLQLYWSPEVDSEGVKFTFETYFYGLPINKVLQLSHLYPFLGTEKRVASFHAHTKGYKFMLAQLSKAADKIKSIAENMAATIQSTIMQFVKSPIVQAIAMMGGLALGMWLMKSDTEVETKLKYEHEIDTLVKHAYYKNKETLPSAPKIEAKHLATMADGTNLFRAESSVYDGTFDRKKNIAKSMLYQNDVGVFAVSDYTVEKQFRDKNADAVLNHKVVPNLVRVGSMKKLEVPEQLTRADYTGGCGLGLKDGAVVIAKHTLEALRSSSTPIVLYRKLGAVWTYTWHTFDPNRAWCHPTKDLAVYDFGTEIPAFKDILKQYVTEKDAVIMGDKFLIANVRLTKQDDGCIETASSMCEVSKVGFKDVYCTGLKYNYSAFNGASGSPIVAFNNRSTRKIMGLHTGTDFTLGLGTIVTYENLITALTSIQEKLVARNGFYDRAVPLPEQTVVKQLQHETIKDLHENGIELSEIFPSSPHKHMIPIGALTPEQSPGSMDKSVFEQLPTYDLIYPATTRPTLTRKEVKRLGIPDPCKKQCEKYGGFVMPIDIGTETMVAADVNRRWLQVLERYRFRKPQLQTEKEIVSGNENFQYLRGLNPDSSIGYPHNLNAKRKGKLDFMDFEQGVITSDALRADIEEAEALLLEGKQPVFIWQDCKKDARVLNEKVAKGKQRAFVIAPAAQTYLTRKYCGDFVSTVMAAHNENSCALGINPEGPEWHGLKERLCRWGTENMRCGDQGNYDGNVSNQWVKHLVYLIQRFYDDEFYDVRRALFAGMMQTTHIFYNSAFEMWVMYQTLHGNKSGSLMTTVENSYVNACIMRAAYVHIWMHCRNPTSITPYLIHNDAKEEDFPDMNDYNDHVTETYFGDDDGGQTHPERLFFNMHNISVVMAHWGLEYTMSSKDGNLVPFVSMKDFMYLKRRFLTDPEYSDITWAPLDRQPLNELFNWTKVGLTHDVALRDNIETFERNIAEHGRDVYNVETQHIKSCLSTMNITYIPRSYDEYLERKKLVYGKLPGCFTMNKTANEFTTLYQYCEGGDGDFALRLSFKGTIE